MNTQNLIEGLTLLQTYRTRLDGYDVSAEHDVIYAFATDAVLYPRDVAKLLKLGWVQKDFDEDGGIYTPEEPWMAYV